MGAGNTAMGKSDKSLFFSSKSRKMISCKVKQNAAMCKWLEVTLDWVPRGLWQVEAEWQGACHQKIWRGQWQAGYTYQLSYETMTQQLKFSKIHHPFLYFHFAIQPWFSTLRKRHPSWVSCHSLGPTFNFLINPLTHSKQMGRHSPLKGGVKPQLLHPDPMKYTLGLGHRFWGPSG